MMLGELYRSGVPAGSVSDYDSVNDFLSPFGRSVRCHSTANGGDYSPQEAYTGLQRYLPSNERDGDVFGREMDSTVDAYSGDQFRMFEFKVRRCPRGRSHDWTECPYAHPGEKACRRDPTKYHYSGTACPDFRKGSCKRGDSCEFSHGVFECWLHPARYRTQPCKDGTSCRRRVCFFAHTAEQLRLLPNQSSKSPNAAACSYDGSPLRQVIEASSAKTLTFLSSPTISPPRSPNAAAYSYDGSPLRQAIEASSAKTLSFLSSPASSPPITPQAESPPMSPSIQSLNRSFGLNPVGQLAASLRNLQINKLKPHPSAWSVQIGSPRGSLLRPEGCSLPATPTRASPRSVNGGYADFWDQALEEEPAMERVESGRGLRAKMFEKLRKENFTSETHLDSSSPAPDVGWISELVQ